MSKVKTESAIGKDRKSGAYRVDLVISQIPLAPVEFWARYAVVLVLGALAWGVMRTPVVTFTVLSLWVAGLACSVCESEQQAMLILVIGLTVGPFAGVVVDAIRTRPRRVESSIGRRYARAYVCPNCDCRFNSVQAIGQCPACDARVSATQ